MNNQQKQQAERLYFQTDLTKTQIAELLNISRRSLHYWIRENNWKRIKKSAAHMPSLIAENCYHIIANYTEQLLSETRIMKPVTAQEADTLHKLTLTVSKLKNHTTLNESMEMFAVFMDGVKAKAPDLAEALVPHVGQYIASRAGVHRNQLFPETFNELGFIPVKDESNEEEKLDMQDVMAWTEHQHPVVDIEQFRGMDETPAAPLSADDETPAGAQPDGYTPPVPGADNEKTANAIPEVQPAVPAPATAPPACHMTPITPENYARYMALKDSLADADSLRLHMADMLHAA